MRNQEKDAIEMAAKRQKILEAGYHLFSTKTISTVTMNEVADACGIGIATLYRYYKTKPILVMAIASWLWENYVKENTHLLEETENVHISAKQRYEFFIETFIDLYRNQKEMLRFNQLFNIYVRSEQVPAGQLDAYNNMIGLMSEKFQEIILKGQQDGTIRKDGSGQVIFSTTLHLMLATATRYAFGLVYTPEGGEEEERELLLMKRMLVSEFTTEAKCNFPPPEGPKPEERPKN